MWGLHLGALAALAVYVATRTPGDRSQYNCLLRWTPFACVVIGSLLMLFDLTRHLLLDQNVAPVALHMYNSDHTLTAVGRFGMTATWVGVVLLVFGTGWFLNYHLKIKNGCGRLYHCLRRPEDTGPGKSQPEEAKREFGSDAEPRNATARDA